MDAASLAAVASDLAGVQRATMPDLAVVLRPEIARGPGGAATTTYSVDRVEPCRLSKARPSERVVGDAGRREAAEYLLHRDRDAALMRGTERVVVLGGGRGRGPRYAVTLRVTGAGVRESAQSVLRDRVERVTGEPEIRVLTGRASVAVRPRGAVTTSA